MKKVVSDYRDLGKKYNALVTKHNDQSDDAKALMAYLMDIARGLAFYGLDFQDNQRVTDFKPISYIGMVEADRAFAIDLYNEVVRFMEEIKAGQRPSKVYEEWREYCIQIAKGGGIIL